MAGSEVAEATTSSTVRKARIISRLPFLSLWFLSGLLLAFILIPIINMAAHQTLQSLSLVAGHATVRSAIWLSLESAALTALVAVILGTPLAALLARDPELWLLDEPHASLDSWTRKVLDDSLNSRVSSGSTVLLVSHETHHGSLVPTRVVEIGGGRVVADSGPVQAAHLEQEARSEQGSDHVA